MRILLVGLDAFTPLCCSEGIFASRARCGEAAAFDFGFMFSPLFFDAGAHLVFSVFRDTADRFGTGSETTESCPTGCAPRLGLGHRQEHHGHNALLFIRDTLLSLRALHALTVASEPSNTMMACAKSGAQYPTSAG